MLAELICIGLAISLCAGDPTTYEGHAVVRVVPRSQQDVDLVKTLNKRNMKVEFWKSPVDGDSPIDLLVPQEDATSLYLLLKMSGVDYHILIPDVQAAMAGQHNSSAREQLGASGINMAQYNDYQQIMDWYARLQLDYPNLVHVVTLGDSVEGRPVQVIKLSSASGEPRPAVWLDAGIHSNEWIGPATLIYFIHQIVSGYGVDREIMWLVDNIDWYIMPLFNPDGYIHTWTEDRLWRKNRGVHSNGCVGVDLNRNWPYMWADGDADTEPCGRMYIGPSAASEPEVRAVVEFLSEHKSLFKAYLAYHSFSQYWMLPYSYSKDRIPSNMEEMVNVSKLAVSALRSVHGTSYTIGRISNLIGEASGSSVDFAYESLAIPLVFGIELRDDGQHGTLLPSNQILPNAEESWAAVKEMAFIIIDKIYAEEGYTLY